MKLIFIDDNMAETGIFEHIAGRKKIKRAQYEYTMSDFEDQMKGKSVVQR